MPRLLLSFKIYMKIYVSFRISEERSNLLITDALERGGGFADGVHLEWKEKINLANEHRHSPLSEKKSQNKKTDQGGAVGAGVGRGQGDQGRDQDPGFHRWEEGWTAVKT